MLFCATPVGKDETIFCRIRGLMLVSNSALDPQRSFLKCESWSVSSYGNISWDGLHMYSKCMIITECHCIITMPSTCTAELHPFCAFCAVIWNSVTTGCAASISWWPLIGPSFVLRLEPCARRLPSTGMQPELCTKEVIMLPVTDRLVPDARVANSRGTTAVSIDQPIQPAVFQPGCLQVCRRYSRPVQQYWRRKGD